MNRNSLRDIDPIHPEKMIRSAEQAIRLGLIESYRLHQKLGEGGTEAMQENIHEEMAMKLDVLSEKNMLDALSKFPYRLLVRTEEHGEVEINTHIDGPSLLAVMDGLDGSSVYKEHRGERKYGPMFVIFSSDNPTYNDFLVSGTLMLSTGDMLIAKKGESLIGENVRTGRRFKARSDQTMILDERAIVYADNSHVSPKHNLREFFELNGIIANELKNKLKVQPFRTGSTAANIFDVATGKAALDIGATRKGNLEFASGYAIIQAAGGIMQTVDGRDLGTQLFLEFGQGKKEHIPVIAAANKHIAKQVEHALAA